MNDDDHGGSTDDEDVVRGSSFFVGATTPTSGASHAPFARQVTIGAESDRVLDYIHNERDRPPRIKITLRPRQLIFYVVSTCIALIIFTAVAFHGIVVQTVYEEIGSSSIANERVELYNTISGFLLALVEVLLSLYMNNFLSVFLVYLHNSLWFMHSNDVVRTASEKLRSTMMLIVPLVLMLTIGNSLRSLQATQKTVGFETIMTKNELFRSQPVVEVIIKQQRSAADAAIEAQQNATLITPNATNATISQLLDLDILTSVVTGYTYPFTVNNMSACSAGGKAKDTDFTISVHDLDTTNLVTAFTAHEWNSEALDQQLTANESIRYRYSTVMNRIENDEPVTQPNFSIPLAFDLFAHGKIILDKAIADTKEYYYPCSDFVDETTGEVLDEDDDADTDDEETDAQQERKRQRSRCLGSRKNLLRLGEIRADPSLQTIERLVQRVTTSLNRTVDRLNYLNTTVKLRTMQLTPQIRADTLEIDLSTRILRTGNGFFNKENRSVYAFGTWAPEFCGSDTCVFIDRAKPFRVPKQIVLMPFQANCSFTNQTISYSREVRGYFPTDCQTEESSVVAVALGSHIYADYYGSDITEWDDAFEDAYGATPYLYRPYRAIRLHITKFTWKTDDLADNFNVTCGRSTGSDTCKGLAYQLSRTNRYVFASEDALPTRQIARASLQAPIRLLQLNEASVYIRRWQQVVYPERLNWRYRGQDTARMAPASWRRKALVNESCSRLMDSYIRHIERNRFYLETPDSTVLRATFFFLFSNSSVTELTNATALILNDTVTPDGRNVSRLVTEDALALVRLKGDVQLRKIRVKVPMNTFRATIGGCIVLVFLALLVVAIPMRRVEFFPYHATRAYEYIRMMNDETYPTAVHKKTLLFPATGDSFPIQDFDIQEMTIVDRAFPEDHEEIKL